MMNPGPVMVISSRPPRRGADRTDPGAVNDDAVAGAARSRHPDALPAQC